MATDPRAEGRQTEPSSNDVYSHFSNRRRRYLVFLLGYVTLASSLTATIYFPLIELLSAQYATSVQGINLTITLYVVFQAVSPALFAPLSDSFGRRPVLLATFAVYCAAGLGLALNRASYAALLVLRGLQSLGGSAVLSLAYGVVADVVASAERGRMLGPLMAATNLGPCMGPLLGGVIAWETRRPDWCFWTLVVFGGTAFLLIGWTLPETNRAIVGNGRVAAQGVWRTWWDALLWLRRGKGRAYNKEQKMGDDAPEGNFPRGLNSVNLTSRGMMANGRGKFIIPNPLGPLRIVFYKDTSLTLWTAAVVYSVWYCIQTSIPVIYGPIYHFNNLQVGLSYLAGGTGVIAGGFLAGRLMDWNYRVVAAAQGLPVDRKRGSDDIAEFPIEQARARGCLLNFAVYLCEVVAFGWLVHCEVHCSASLVLQFLIGAQGTMIHQAFNALLVDIFPESPSTAAAAGNITRCGMSAAVVAFMEPLVSAVGRGYFFTLIGLISSLSGMAAILVLTRKGHAWRKHRLRGKYCATASGSDLAGSQAQTEKSQQ
ncbi:hypothetical protein PG993_009301 [Apiospora rasikravindrae]|uniref:Major facilitator superfamily (MFS) profile domain-containing protein n=1 Tax=Apiospora rasikravindrae TaxID=990691 RepID=A0ABR1SJ02_9PEZI